MEAMWGATLGKMLLRLHVVKTDGSPISWSAPQFSIRWQFLVFAASLLLRDLPLDQRHCKLIGKALDVEAIARHLDNRPGILMNQICHIQCVLLGVCL